MPLNACKILSLALLLVSSAFADPPNIILVITDDQGYADLACHGNPHLRTPNIDRFNSESARLSRFYASPVCSPTRASLMTGRYNYRTGVVDTYIGRSMMHSAGEFTIAEHLRAAGYETGLFGKWHLGDHFPMRPQDQGFDEVLTHNGGGIGQPSDPPGNDYFDPLLLHNGVSKEYKGYCTDIFFNAAKHWIAANKTGPFFACIATNAPHTPLEAPDAFVRPYLEMGLDEKTARTYGMIENIDDNFGAMMTHLIELGIERNTIVVFMTDNGIVPHGVTTRYDAGLRGTKGTVYEGGIRVPFMLRWQEHIEPGERSATAAHIDIMPTLLELVGIHLPASLPLDGVSFAALLRNPSATMPPRQYFLQWHRGNTPEPHNNAVVISGVWRLVNGSELYDIDADPRQAQNVAGDFPEVVEMLRGHYEKWLETVAEARGYAPPPIVLGAPEEPVSILTPQDWRDPTGEGWGDGLSAHWIVRTAQAGDYTVRLEFLDPQPEATVEITCAESRILVQVPEGSTHAETTLRLPQLPVEPARLAFQVNASGATKGLRYLTISKAP